MNIETLRWGLEELSDRSLQEKLWTGKIEGEMSSFSEAITSTFDASGLGRALEVGKCEELSNQAIKLARQLDIEARKVPQVDAPAKTINQPSMVNVRLLAGELLSLIR